MEETKDGTTEWWLWQHEVDFMKEWIRNYKNHYLIVQTYEAVNVEKWNKRTKWEVVTRQKQSGKHEVVTMWTRSGNHVNMKW